jgi:two-component sensor histidine kinase
MRLVGNGSMSTLTATLPGMPASVAIARRLVREALPDCPRADDLILAVSELASNAIVHSASGQGGTVSVRVRTAPRWARAEVTDDGPAAGVIAARNGWGLEIIAGITDQTGALIRPDGRRTAWAEVTWAPSRPGETHTAGF